MARPQSEAGAEFLKTIGENKKTETLERWGGGEMVVGELEGFVVLKTSWF